MVSFKRVLPDNQQPGTYLLSVTHNNGKANHTITIGAVGERGPAGTNGADGADSTIAGPAGKNGTNGTNGTNGLDSTVAGPAGNDGADGADSTVKGPKGDKGKTGSTGPAGSSARGIRLYNCPVNVVNGNCAGLSTTPTCHIRGDTRTCTAVGYLIN